MKTNRALLAALLASATLVHAGCNDDGSSNDTTDTGGDVSTDTALPDVTDPGDTTDPDATDPGDTTDAGDTDPDVVDPPDEGYDPTVRSDLAWTVTLMTDPSFEDTTLSDGERDFSSFWSDFTFFGDVQTRAYRLTTAERDDVPDYFPALDGAQVLDMRSASGDGYGVASSFNLPHFQVPAGRTIAFSASLVVPEGTTAPSVVGIGIQTDGESARRLDAAWVAMSLVASPPVGEQQDLWIEFTVPEGMGGLSFRPVALFYANDRAGARVWFDNFAAWQVDDQPEDLPVPDTAYVLNPGFELPAMPPGFYIPNAWGTERVTWSRFAIVNAQDRGISGFRGRQLLDLQTTSLGSVRFPIYGLEEDKAYEVTIAARRGAEPAPTSVFFSFQIGSRFIGSTTFDMVTLGTTDNWVEATNCLDVRTGEAGLQAIINFAAEASGAGNLFVDEIRFREVASCD